MSAPVRAIALAGMAVIVGLASARVAESHYATGAITLLIAVPVLYLLASRPLLSMIGMLLVLGTVFEYGILPRANVPGHPPINASDALLALIVLGTIWRRPWRTWPEPVRIYGLVVILLVALASISSVQLAFQGGSAARNASLGIKNILYLSLALTVALELRGRLWKPLLNTAVAIAAIVSVISILAALSGSVSSFLNHYDPASVTSISNQGSFGSSTRIRLPGLFLAYAMVIPTFVLVMVENDRWRRLRVVALLLMIAAVAVSLNRNMYFGGLLGLTVTALVGGPRLRYRLVFTLAVVAAAGALVLESVKPAATTEIEQRATSALSSQVLSSGSAQARSIEFHYALQAIGHHPLDGVGWLQPYGFDQSGLGQRVFVEDIYLHMTTDYGIPFALAFILLPGFLLVYGVRRARVAVDPVDRAILAGTIGSVVSLMLSALVGTYLQAPDTMASFAVACGLLLAASLRATPSGITLPASARQASTPRVLVTCDWFLKYAVDQCIGLRQAGAEVALLCRTHAFEFGDDAEEREQVIDMARAVGVRILEIPGRVSDVRVMPSLRSLRAQLSDFGPQVVHAHDGADPRALPLLTKIPTVLTVHDPAPHPGQPVAPTRKRWFLTSSREAWRERATMLIVHSELLKAQMPPKDIHRTVVIPHGINVRDEPLEPPPDPTVSFFGRLAPYKGLDVLAKAMPQVWKRRPEVRLKVAGAGDAPFNLRDRRAEVSRTYLPEDAVEEFFADTSLAVLPYTQASQTGVGSVAIGLGVPVVVSNLGGLPDLTLDDSYVAEPGNARALASAILAHIDDPVSERALMLEQVARPRSWESAAHQSLALYERVLMR